MKFLLCGGCLIKPRLTYDGKSVYYRDSSLVDVSILNSKHIITVKKLSGQSESRYENTADGRIKIELN